MNLVYMDHQTLSRIASEEDVEDMWYTPEERVEDKKTIQNLLRELSEEERELYDLYFIRRVKQETIAALYQITQGGVSHRIKNLEKKLKLLNELPEIDWKEVRSSLKPRLIKALDLLLKHGSRKKAYVAAKIPQPTFNKNINEIYEILEGTKASIYLKDLERVNR